MSKTGNSTSKIRHAQQKKGTVINFRRKKSVAAKATARKAKISKAKTTKVTAKAA